jgi:Sulfotransferase family
VTTGSTVVCVLGPPRSGTSLTGMLLNSLGVFFGRDDHLSRPYEGNPKGSWEHLGIEKINRELLARLGGSWDEPPELPNGWEEDSLFEALRADARSLIREEFTGAAVWGWKDPPTCFTLPFWRTVLPPMHYVICLRNPLDVARSLERRDRFSLEKGFHLWLLHTKAALRNTEHERRAFVFSERWIDGWQEQLQRLARFLDVPRGQMVEDGAIEAVIDKNLWHYRSSLNSMTRSLQIYQEVLQESFSLDDLDRRLQEVIELIAPEAEKRESLRQEKESRRWNDQLRNAICDLESLIPPQDTLILVDQAELGYVGRTSVPFVERDGKYWGPPADDVAAIQEFERLRSSGATFIVFAWPAFWWLDHYPGLNRYLRSMFRCVVHNERVAVFDLRVETALSARCEVPGALGL